MEKKPELTTREKVELNNFMKNNPEIGTGARRDVFEDRATKELLYLREVNEQRKAEGLEELNPADRTLSLRNGVVKSFYRAKEEQQMNKEELRAAIISSNSTMRDA